MQESSSIDQGPGGPERPVVTVTLNPALDISTTVDVVTPENKLRCTTALREPGGGGINVARVASRLGVDVTAVAVVGGATGRQLVSLMDAEGLTTEPVPVDVETRQSFSVLERSTDRQYRFVLPGPDLDRPTMEAVVETVAGLVGSSADPLVVVSGSLPPTTPAGALAELILSLSPADVIVDTSGPALTETLRSPVTLAKPSARELASVVDRSLETESDILGAVVEVFDRSTVDAILVSIGAGGAILVTTAGGPVRLRAPTVRVRSAVGAGDSMVGGVVVGLARGYDMLEAARLGVAAGTAAVVTEGSKLCAASRVEQLLPLVSIEQVDGPDVSP